MIRYTEEQAQAMVGNAYVKALNDQAGYIPDVRKLEHELKQAGTWPYAPDAESELRRAAQEIVDVVEHDWTIDELTPLMERLGRALRDE